MIKQHNESLTTNTPSLGGGRRRFEKIILGIDPGTKRRKAMQVRIVKEEHLPLDGKLSVHYVPEYKGWFFWNRFVEYDCDSCCTQASFKTHEEAQAFLDNAVRMRGRDLTTVVAVGEAERTGKS